MPFISYCKLLPITDKMTLYLYYFYAAKKYNFLITEDTNFTRKHNDVSNAKVRRRKHKQCHSQVTIEQQ